MKPAHLTTDNAARFQDAEVAALYRLRPPYPTEVFTTLASLITDEPRTVLDVGAGRGEIARFLTPYAERVDAVDPSPAMIAAGKQDPDGDASHLRWIEGKAEEVELDPPFALIVGGSSFHWLDWEVAFARFEALLTPNGYVAMVNREIPHSPWHEPLRELSRRYSTPPAYEPFDLIQELTRLGLFMQVGEYHTNPAIITQPIEEYIDAQHSFSRLTRDSMTPERAVEFDEALRALVTPHATDGMLTIEVVGHVVWGKPHAPAPPTA